METVQGIRFDELSKEYGTPLYVYDAAILDRQVSAFKNAFNGLDVKLKFAVKSCANISILKYMKSVGLGLDTVSIPEIHMGLSLGYKAEEIVFTPNVVEFEEIKQAVDLGVPVTIENLQNLESFGKHYGNRVGCCIRLNPNVVDEVKHADISGIDFKSVNKEHYSEIEEQKIASWHNQSKFGISLSQYDQLIKIIDKYNIQIDGIHLHSSHVILNKEVFIKGVQTVFRIVREFPKVKYVDFGGGIMVKHHKDDVVIELDEIGPLFKIEYEKLCKEINREIEVWFEPGRFLISEAGYLLTKAVVLKSNGCINFVGVDTGFNHLLRPMMYDAYHEIINISNPDARLIRYNVVGNLCEIDNLATDRKLNEVRRDDLLLIKNTGAYGFSMSSNYNSRFKPAEVLVYNNRAHLIRARQKYDDLLNNQIEIEF